MLEQLLNLNICATDQILFLDDMISQVNFFEIFKHKLGDISNDEAGVRPTEACFQLRGLLV